MQLYTTKGGIKMKKRFKVLTIALVLFLALGLASTVSATCDHDWVFYQSLGTEEIDREYLGPIGPDVYFIYYEVTYEERWLEVCTICGAQIGRSRTYTKVICYDPWDN